MKKIIILFCLTTTGFSQSIKFRPQMIAAESFESVSVFDVNKDGNLDLISGYYWYKGPSFRDRVYMGSIERHGEYWDCFSNLPFDANGDGYTDFITGGWWGNQCY